MAEQFLKRYPALMTIITGLIVGMGTAVGINWYTAYQLRSAEQQTIIQHMANIVKNKDQSDKEYAETKAKIATIESNLSGIRQDIKNLDQRMKMIETKGVPPEEWFHSLVRKIEARQEQIILSVQELQWNIQNKPKLNSEYNGLLKKDAPGHNVGPEFVPKMP